MSRESTATQIFSALLAKYTHLDPPAEKVAKQAVEYTDALLAELERTSKPSGYHWETLDEAEKRISSTLKNYPEGDE